MIDLVFCILVYITGPKVYTVFYVKRSFIGFSKNKKGVVKERHGEF